MEHVLHLTQCMTSRVELDIDASQEPLALAFAEPRNNPIWMHDIDRIEPLSGELGQTGSTYRLIPKDEGRAFTARVEHRTLPRQLKLFLDSSDVSVSITDTFQPITQRKTKLISEETFTFKSLFGRFTGLFAGPAIKRAHRRHMEDFKRFAESRLGSTRRTLTEEY